MSSVKFVHLGDGQDAPQDKKLEALSWCNFRVPPQIGTVEELWQVSQIHKIESSHTISWWGDAENPLPAGFTRFEFQARLQDGSFIIILDTEPRPSTVKIKGKELVVYRFQSIGEADDEA